MHLCASMMILFTNISLNNPEHPSKNLNRTTDEIEGVLGNEVVECLVNNM